MQVAELVSCLFAYFKRALYQVQLIPTGRLERSIGQVAQKSVARFSPEITVRKMLLYFAALYHAATLNTFGKFLDQFQQGTNTE